MANRIDHETRDERAVGIRAELLEQALRSKEPYAIQSLSGMSALMMTDAARGAQAEVTDAALALLSCDLGASCGPESLLALQLCALEGRCEGTAREQMLERLGPVDMEAVEVERKRLRALRRRTSERYLDLARRPLTAAQDPADSVDPVGDQLGRGRACFAARCADCRMARARSMTGRSIILPSRRTALPLA